MWEHRDTDRNADDSVGVEQSRDNLRVKALSTKLLCAGNLKPDSERKEG